MTAVAERAGAPGVPAEPGPLVRFGWAVSDTLTITRRNLLVWMRVPAYLVFTVIQPVIFVLMFRYVFGGAIPINGPGGYVNFLIPGIVAQTAAFASFGTAMAMILLAIVFGVAICCISAYTGLAIGDEESVQAFGLIWLFPLTFLSSAFVPIRTMPGWLQAFANNQPVTYVVDTMRALALGGPVEASLWKSVAWLAGIFIVFLPLAVRAYRRGRLARPLVGGGPCGGGE